MNISVIIPTYNRADVLSRALDSVFAQTTPPYEVIVVDDGSSDDTATLMQQHYPDCTYLQQENRGVSSARNLGIQHANGEWLAFLDSDDEWLPGKLAEQVELLQQQPEQRICHTEEIWVRNGTRVNAMKKHTKTGGYIFKRCLPLCVISPSAVMIHRDIFDQVGLFDENLPACEDYDLWLRICARHSVAYVETPQIIKYGGHDDQLSQKHWGMDRFRLVALEKIINSGALTNDDLNAAISMLQKKANILANGADKRDKRVEAEQYRTLAKQYQPAIG
ncbi:MAG: glycosyltransferase [Chromatiales bacterium]|nr:glycosyltransferase [Chromatiales bacterium]